MTKEDKQKPADEPIVTDADEKKNEAEEVEAEVIEDVQSEEVKSEEPKAEDSAKIPPDDSISDKISAATDKGVAIAKELFDKAKHYSTEAVDLTRLKIDLYNLKADRDRLYKKMGMHLAELYKEDKFRGIKAAFTEQFEQLESLETKIAEKEEEINNINF